MLEVYLLDGMANRRSFQASKATAAPPQSPTRLVDRPNGVKMGIK